ncbi:MULTISPECIES: Abi family protein [unclassified Rathayibacter]|uniref:Abi family protein n=1 Tax=unclassified Rathayibacter TaxID=2609250 RepID=UPI0012E783ED|nr:MULTISPECIES: Abi family protein [unclassified Rathayibacter]
MAGNPKNFTTIPQQAAILTSRGMILDIDAEQWLRSVNYYRLSGYWFVYRKLETVGGQLRRGDDFHAGTRFSEVAALYEFDRQLRTLVHDGVERFEIALRRAVTDVIARHDPLGHRNSALFRSDFDHAGWLAKSQDRVARAARRSDSIRHHQDKLGGTIPLWVLVEVLDFADVSLLVEGMTATDQWSIASELGLIPDLTLLSGNQLTKAKRRHPIVNWLEQLSLVRNICAHHGRLWNRTVIPAGTALMRAVPRLSSLPVGQSESTYGSLALLAKTMEATLPGSSWREKLVRLVTRRLEGETGRSAAEMGFPTGWAEDDLWT